MPNCHLSPYLLLESGADFGCKNTQYFGPVVKVNNYHLETAVAQFTPFSGLFLTGKVSKYRKKRETVVFYNIYVLARPLFYR